MIFIASLIFPGIITRVKSIASGRKGPPIFQSIFDIIRLLKKGTIYSTTTSFIYKIAVKHCIRCLLNLHFLY